jgi:putative oxidoreductase
MMAIFYTDGGVSVTIIRITLGIVMMPHGIGMMFGRFGFPGVGPMMAGSREQIGMPPGLVLFAALAEFIGPVGLILGLLTRVAALGIALTMIGAIWVHRGGGFFMNWFGAQKDEGIEYHLMALAMAVSLMITGAGAWSIDRMIAH